MPLKDDPRLLDGPIGFAVNVEEDEGLDFPQARKRISGLMQFVQTFTGVVLEQEFGVRAGGFPSATRERAAALTSRLKLEGKGDSTDQMLLYAIVDLCDLDIDREEMSGEDEEDEGANEILDLVENLLESFAAWVDPTRLPKLREEAIRGVDKFAKAAEKLR